MYENRLADSQYKMLLFDFTLKTMRESGTMPSNPIAVKTIMTSDMADAIAEHYQVDMIYRIPSTEGEDVQRISDERCVFSFEAAEDPDVSAGMIAYYVEQDLTLQEAMESLYEKYGYFKDGFLWLNYGEQKNVNYIMSVMRFYMPHTVGGYEVVKAVNYEVKLPYEKEDRRVRKLSKVFVLEFILKNQARMIIHPSSTDPKLGVYLFAKGESKDMVHHVLDNLEKYIKVELQA